jgi:hypothetical protein
VTINIEEEQAELTTSHIVIEEAMVNTHPIWCGNSTVSVLEMNI